MIERYATIADYLYLIPRYEKLESLSISFNQRERSFLGVPSFFPSHSLVRLDLTYSDVFWRPITLDFPNLEYLRLASEKPLVRRSEPIYIPAMCGVDGYRFAVSHSQIIEPYIQTHDIRSDLQFIQPG